MRGDTMGTPGGYRAIAPEENCTPTLKLTITLIQILTLNGGQFSSGAIVRIPPLANTAWKVSVWEAILVRIFPHSGFIRTKKTPHTNTFYAVKLSNKRYDLNKHSMHAFTQSFTAWYIYKVYLQRKLYVYDLINI